MREIFQFVIYLKAKLHRYAIKIIALSELKDQFGLRNKFTFKK